ncbi:hypothetical protein C0995_013935 [Termitomyces sp. Mi166|nr:hypothetical protein C0995_013935 [Termitomyces sp. Mi166\
MKAMEEDNEDNEDEVTKKICQELEDFVVPTTELAALLPLPSEYFEKDVRLLKKDKISGGWKGNLIVIVVLLTTWSRAAGT